MEFYIDSIDDRNWQSAASLIAPCGMNCGMCLAYLREKNRCKGCRVNDVHKTSSRTACVIKNCQLLSSKDSGFCYDCGKYPCRRLRQLDNRYKTRYSMSMLDNLESIKKNGLEMFVETEQKRWICPNCGATLCVHRKFCLKCNNTLS